MCNLTSLKHPVYVYTAIINKKSFNISMIIATVKRVVVRRNFKPNLHTIIKNKYL